MVGYSNAQRACEHYYGYENWGCQREEIADRHNAPDQPKKAWGFYEQNFQKFGVVSRREIQRRRQGPPKFDFQWTFEIREFLREYLFTIRASLPTFDRSMWLFPNRQTKNAHVDDRTPLEPALCRNDVHRGRDQNLVPPKKVETFVSVRLLWHHDDLRVHNQIHRIGRDTQKHTVLQSRHEHCTEGNHPQASSIKVQPWTAAPKKTRALAQAHESGHEDS